jgi:hypothetical protein
LDCSLNDLPSQGPERSVHRMLPNGMAAKMRHSEQTAKCVIETLTPGAKMEFVEDQSSSVCDFALFLADGRVGAVEVTSARERVELETNAAILRRRYGGHTINAALSKKAWRIRPRSGADITLIREKADAALAAVEAAGFTSFGPGATPNDAAIDYVANDLGIFFGNVIDSVRPGVITLAPPMGGGAIGPSLVHDAFMIEAERPDNRKKLADSHAPERHLAVYVDPAHHRAWVPLVELAPPEETVCLPSEITHGWVFSEARIEGVHVIWRGQTGGPWQRLTIGPNATP